MSYFRYKIDLWRSAQQSYQAFLKTISEPHSNVTDADGNPVVVDESVLEKVKAKRTEEINKARTEKENDNDITHFIASVKEKLDNFKQYDQEFWDRVKTLEDPEVDREMQELVYKVCSMRDIITYSYFYQTRDILKDPYPTLQEVVDLLLDLEISDEYTEILKNYYIVEQSNQDIIKALLD